MRAVVLAGGRGTRLRPFTASFPKPLVPVGDRPVLELLINGLVSRGISDITLSLGHMAELVQAYFYHRQDLLRRLTLRYIVEVEPTGTAGSLALIDGLDDTFLVMNGDLVTDLDFHDLVEFHKRQGAVMTIATQRRHVTIDLGVIEFDSGARVTNYLEKPTHSYDVSMGVYVYEPSVLRHIKRGEYLDFPNLVHRVVADGQRVCAYQTDCLWLDIGRPDDYAQAQDMVADHKDRFDIDFRTHSAQ